MWKCIHTSPDFLRFGVRFFISLHGFIDGSIDKGSCTFTHCISVILNDGTLLWGNTNFYFNESIIVFLINAKIIGKNDIKNYADYLFEHAGPAIMSWIIEGAKKAIDKDFHTDLPDVVEAAIKAYREDNDWLGQFLEECCEIDPSYKEKSGELYQAYRAHCMQNGEYIRSTTDFYSAMDKAGYNRIRKNTGVQVVGLKLKEGQDFLG